jgi:hypothetical protein
MRASIRFCAGDERIVRTRGGRRDIEAAGGERNGAMEWGKR